MLSWKAFCAGIDFPVLENIFSTVQHVLATRLLLQELLFFKEISNFATFPRLF